MWTGASTQTVHIPRHAGVSHVRCTPASLLCQVILSSSFLSAVKGNPSLTASLAGTYLHRADLLPSLALLTSARRLCYITHKQSPGLRLVQLQTRASLTFLDSARERISIFYSSLGNESSGE